MSHCLNPKNPHKNADIPAAILPSAHATHSSVTMDTVERVTCQYCKYLLEGAILGDCRVLRWLGSGAFGDVYEAEQLPPLKRKVALKIMAIEHVTNGRAAELFEREVRSVAALDHPNILPILRVGMIADGHPYFVMKYAAHGSLQKFLQTSPALFSILPTMSAEKKADAHIVSTDTVQIAPEQEENGVEQDETTAIPDAQVAASEQEALANSDEESIESQSESSVDEVPSLSSEEQVVTDEPETDIEAIQTQIVERNADEDEDPGATELMKSVEPGVLSPQELLPYLEAACAGLQYAHDHDIIHLDVKPANLLLDGDDRLMLADFGVSALLDGYTHASLQGYVGTPLYTAPEQWLEQPRAASDQYALGVTCYQLLTGRAPFTGNLYSIMHGHLKLPAPSMREIRSDIPEAVDKVILRALAKEPHDRYEDMRAFAHAYREAVEHGIRPDEMDRLRESAKHRAMLVEQAQTHMLPSGKNAATTFPDNKQEEQNGEQQPEQREQTKEPVVGAKPEVLSVAPARKVQPLRSQWWKAASIVLVCAILAGSAFGAIRVFRPYWLGIHPTIILSTDHIDLMNSETKRITLSNHGNEDLAWQANIPSDDSWLKITPDRGVIRQGSSILLAIMSNADQQPAGIHEALIQITGNESVPLNIRVNLHVLTGLANVSVKADGTDFDLTQAGLEPKEQKITITNKSGKKLKWHATYQGSNWLQITPESGDIANGATSTITATANVETFASNSYLTTSETLQLIGQLDGQTDSSVLPSVTFNLKVEQSPQGSSTPGTQPTPQPTQSPYSFNTYTVQPATSTAGPTAPRSGHSMVWDDADNRILVFGGVDNAGNLLNDLWSYTPSTGAWKQLSSPAPASNSGACGTAPSARMNAAMVWDNNEQQLLLYGGIGANNAYLGDLWSFSFQSGWQAISCSSSGPGARMTSAVWDGTGMVIVGGKNASGVQKDMWKFSVRASKWEQLADAPFLSRVYETLVWDTTDSRLYLFGGQDASGAQLNDFWSYTANNGWNQVTPASTSNPGPRQQGMGVWDSKDKVLFLMGGWQDGQGVPYWGFWVYDPQQNAWGLLLPKLANTSAPHIPGRTASVMVWDATDQRAYLYAGAGNGASGSSLSDLWMIS